MREEPFELTVQGGTLHGHSGGEGRPALQAALIPGAQVEVIADCGHFPWLEKPAEFRAAVERFLA